MKKNCTTCNLSEFDKTKSGRRNLDHGQCKAVVIFPHCFLRYSLDFPLKSPIGKYTKPDCPLWEKIKK